MQCTYERTIYHDPSNGFRILSYRTNDASVPVSARSKTRRGAGIFFTATGYYMPETSSVDVELYGKWKESKYGLQLAVDSFSEIMPKTRDGIKGYLSSGLIKGIGPKTAGLLVDTFGDEVLEVMDKHPERLLSVRGISKAKLERIMRTYRESKTLRDIVAFLSPYGISVNKCAKIQQRFGKDAPKMLREDPYRLCDISGFGFKTADLIARRLHCPPGSPQRIKGGIQYVLDESSHQGHTFLPLDALCTRTTELLNEAFPTPVADQDAVKRGIYELIVAGRLCRKDENIYLKYLYSAEHKTAEHIVSLLKQPVIPLRNDLESALEHSQAGLGIMLAEQQKEAVRRCMTSPVSILTGGPGTGKTTVLRVILDVYRKVLGGSVLLAAPTSRASRRMAESTGMPAYTLHSCLGLTAGDEDGLHSFRETLDADFMVVDEMSMVDICLAKELFCHLKPGARVLLVGDMDQLPSVGPGNVFRDLIACGKIPVTRLDIVFRQASTSRIAVNARYMQEDRTNLLYGNDFQFVCCETDEEATDEIEKRYLEELSARDLAQVQVLAPFRSRGPASVVELNRRLREKVNPARPGLREYTCEGRLFREGDRLVQTKNRGQICNGDVGFLRAIELDEEKAPVFTIDFSDSRTVKYRREEMACIEHSYATTIHKSQGSEYAVVLMPLLRSHYIMLRRNLVYTGITRAREKVILAGQKQALYMSIHKNDTDKRNSLLDFWISSLFII